jgi:hypothetical protein
LTSFTRREFLRESLVRGSAAGVAGLGAGTLAADALARVGPPHGIRRRVVLGRSGIEVPDISFGSFSLESDERLVHHALDRGITHFDTAESYTEGRAETVLGRALAGRRQDVTITSKFWAEPRHTTARQMQVLETSLQRLGTDYIDIYLNHAVNDVVRLQSEEWLRFAELAKKQGKIRAIGMSGHAGHLVECLGYALDENLVDVILVAYNFSQQPSFSESVSRYLQDLAASFDLISSHPQLPAMIARAHDAGVGVMVMKTLKGARRNDMRPFEAPGRTFSQSAFRWVLSDPGVDGLVVSMTSEEMIDEYVEASGSGAPDQDDLALLTRYETRNAGTTCQIGCSDCVGSCPVNVPIPDVMRMRMYDVDYGQPVVASREYAQLATNASACLACSGEPCRTACPNGLAIPQLNRDTHRRLSASPGR